MCAFGDGADGVAPFVSGKQKKRVMMLVLRHVHSIAVQLARIARHVVRLGQHGRRELLPHSRGETLSCSPDR